MALALFIGIIVMMVLLARAGKKSRQQKAFNRLSQSQKEAVITAERRRQVETDELITTILPTISDK